MYQWRNVGFVKKGVSTEKSIRLMIDLIQMRREYGRMKVLQEAFEEVEEKFFNQVCGPVSRERTDRFNIGISDE